MPFELIVQDAFTERLPDNGVRVRVPGEHITDPDEVAALDGHLRVVRVWVDEPMPAPSSEPKSEVVGAVATDVILPTAKPAPSAKPATPTPASAPAAS